MGCCRPAVLENMPAKKPMKMITRDTSQLCTFLRSRAIAPARQSATSAQPCPPETTEMIDTGLGCQHSIQV